MTMPATSGERPHDDPALFREAINLTAARTGFAHRLIEKDYFCTLLLEYLSTAAPSLVFKGGTCIAKVHANFYRLSEDLDFAIPLAHDATRKARSQAAKGFKQALLALPHQQPVFDVIQPSQGANNSTQYIAVVGYRSLTAGLVDRIKLEVGLREPFFTSPMAGAAKTLLLDPIDEQPLLAPVAVNCLSRLEAYAEKFRAALSRRDVAVRDFYDLDHAVRLLGLRVDDRELIDLVRMKLGAPGNDAVDVSATRLGALRAQIEAELRPVLRAEDFVEFDIDRAISIVIAMAGRVS
jgi:predicted nucleotidyltransferase component of viral defense system